MGHLVAVMSFSQQSMATTVYSGKSNMAPTNPVELFCILLTGVAKGQHWRHWRGDRVEFLEGFCSPLIHS
ncbi:hypothetical protein XELAEV_18008342mg [Xenopus laevis]|uniref:Uncharacterized protein n=1 Tax=Xenopus laevis TaxID=8355 RepID=A0A974E338_XENLA|nr:hypothetical protein XELAEV_18008342mg [Xenopus laevis]